MLGGLGCGGRRWFLLASEWPDSWNIRGKRNGTYRRTMVSEGSRFVSFRFISSAWFTIHRMLATAMVKEQIVF